MIEVGCYGAIYCHGRRDQQEVKRCWKSAKVIVQHNGDDTSGTWCSRNYKSGSASMIKPRLATHTDHEHIATLAVIDSVRGDVPFFSLSHKDDGADRASLDEMYRNQRASQRGKQVNSC